MPYKRQSQFSGHFLSPDFGAFHTKRDFFNSHTRLHSKPLPGHFERYGDITTVEDYANVTWRAEPTRTSIISYDNAGAV